MLRSFSRTLTRQEITGIKPQFFSYSTDLHYHDGLKTASYLECKV